MKNKKKTKNIIVIYHGDCPDGFGAAWAAWKKFGNRAEYIKGVRDNPPKAIGKEIYILDFSYSPKKTWGLIKNNKRVTGIDHHLTAESSIKLTCNYSFNLKHSGAVLSWRYFHPKKKVPAILKYIEDSDLRAYKMPHYNEILSYIELFDFSFGDWEKISKKLENASTRKKVVGIGKYLAVYREKLVQRIIKHAYWVCFKGKRVLAVGISSSRQFLGAVGEALLKQSTPFVIIWSEKNGVRSISLKSKGGVDVEKIAKKYGGGGHKFNAAFRMDTSKSPPWKLMNPDRRYQGKR